MIDSESVRRLQRQAAEALSVTSPALEAFSRQAAEAFTVRSEVVEAFSRQAAEALSATSPALEAFSRQAAEAFTVRSEVVEAFSRQAAEALSATSPALEAFSRQAAEALSVTSPALEALQRQAAHLVDDVDLSQLLSLTTTTDVRLETPASTLSEGPTSDPSDDVVAQALDAAFKVLLLWLFCAAIAPALLAITLYSTSVTKSTAEMFWNAKDELPVDEALEILGTAGGVASIASFVQGMKSKRKQDGDQEVTHV